MRRPFKIRCYFLLFYELCDDTVENFVIGDSSSDDGVLARWDINVEKSVQELKIKQRLS